MTHNTPPVPAPTRRRNWPLVLVLVALVAAAFGLGVVVGAETGGDDDPGIGETAGTGVGPGAHQTEPADPVVDEPTPEPEPEPVGYEPAADDFTLNIVELEKSCFGSAGCNVTYRIEVGYDGEPLDPDVTYEVTYEIEGGDDIKINTLTVIGDQYMTDESEFIGTPSSGADLVAVVTRVSER